MRTTKEHHTSRTDSSAGCVMPNVTILENKDGYVLQAEMPGVSKSGLEITLTGNELTIEGRRSDETVKAELLYRESRPLNYRRTFELDPIIDTGRIDARIEQGILTLCLPKQEGSKPRKIAIGE